MRGFLFERLKRERAEKLADWNKAACATSLIITASRFFDKNDWGSR